MTTYRGGSGVTDDPPWAPGCQYARTAGFGGGLFGFSQAATFSARQRKPAQRQSTQTLSLTRGPATIPIFHLGERERTCDALCKRVYVNRVCMRWDMEPCTRTEPTTLSRGNPAQTGRHLGQGERSPSNKPYLQRVTEWTRHSRACARYRVYSTLSK